VLTRGDPRTLNSLGWSARVLAARSAKAEDLKRAETTLRETVDAMRKLLGDADPNTIFAMRGLADTLYAQGRFDEALALYEQTLALARTAQSPTSDSAIFSAVSIAAILTDQKGEPGKALAVLEPIRAALRAEKDPDARTCIRVLDNLAYAQGKAAQLNPSPAAWQSAEATNREALELASKALGEEHPISFGLRGNLAALLLKRGDAEGARALQERSVQLGRRVLPPTDPGLLRALNDLGQSHSQAGDNAKALPLIAEAELGFRAGLGIGDSATQGVVTSHARALLKMGRANEAIPKLDEVLAQRTASLGSSEIDTIDSARELGRALAIARRFADADAIFVKAESAIDPSRRPPTSDARWSLVNQWLHTLKAWAAAEPKGPAAGRMPAVNAKIDELRKARLAATPPLPVEWKDI
jgi:tetratricopeptide (TPR) repeat protein